MLILIALIGSLCISNCVWKNDRSSKQSEDIQTVVEMESENEYTGEIKVVSPVKGIVKNIGESSDPTFASKAGEMVLQLSLMMVKLWHLVMEK